MVLSLRIWNYLAAIEAWLLFAFKSPLKTPPECKLVGDFFVPSAAESEFAPPVGAGSALHARAACGSKGVGFEARNNPPTKDTPLRPSCRCKFSANECTCAKVHLPTACCISMRAEICGPPMTSRAHTHNVPPNGAASYMQTSTKAAPNIFIVAKISRFACDAYQHEAMHARHRSPLINHANFINSTF